MAKDVNSPFHRYVGIAANEKGTVWRLTLNGRVLGDSRGYSKAEAEEEARRFVNQDPEFRTLKL